MRNPVFDGHHDALLRLAGEDGVDGFLTGGGGGAVDVPRARAGGLAAAMFAVFVRTPGFDLDHAVKASPGGWAVPPIAAVDGGYAAREAGRTTGRLLALEAAGAVDLVRDPADLDRAAAGDVLGAVLHLEGAEPLDPGLGTLEEWHAAGLRSLGPVWSRPNAFGEGVPFRFPSSPDTGDGLTAAGRHLVRRCQALGILLDVSHLNEVGFWDLARVAERPFVASHSGVHALCPSARNLTDAQIDAIAGLGGLVGVIFEPASLRADGANERATPLTEVVRHVRHVADRVGVDHVALGSDFDGATTPDALADVAALPGLLDALRDDGFARDEVDRIAWGNWRRVLGDVWGG